MTPHMIQASLPTLVMQRSRPEFQVRIRMPRKMEEDYIISAA